MKNIDLSSHHEHLIKRTSKRPPATEKFQELVLAYYRDCGRQLPWRETVNPYHIMVSEFMLQQTQVDRVLKKYPEFIQKFPMLSDLARASVESVLSCWQGLGYNRRALHLKQSAQIIVSDYEGLVPADEGIFKSMPGIGPATAAAICAFAYKKPVILIETNIRTVFLYFYFAGKNNVPDKEILPLVKKTLYRQDPRAWYYALMDYGVFIKKHLPNPGRKSANHKRQSKFEGSNRQVRGMIIKTLSETNPISRQALKERLRISDKMLSGILEQLAKEGLIIVSQETISFP